MMSNKKSYNTQEIAENFISSDSVVSIKAFGSGHINDTFLIETLTGQENLVLQRVNHQIFPNVPELQRNLTKVTNHLREKMKGNPKKDLNRNVLRGLPTLDGEDCFIDAEGNFWRITIEIEDCVSYDLVSSDKLAFEAGKTFGEFQALLNDFDGSELYTIIPDFHHIPKRLEKFEQAVTDDCTDRVKAAEELIQFVRERAESMSLLQQMMDSGELPIRVTHNDTKISNVLFDRNEEGLCVIDLDTVMPGILHFDYGDAIRTGTNRADEDEKDLSKVAMDLNLYKAYTEGFLTEVGALMTEKEQEYLAFSARMMTFIIGLRFFTDYLEGDVYFKTQYEDHNLVRAKSQFALVKDMENKSEQMEAIVSSALVAQ